MIEVGQLILFREPPPPWRRLIARLRWCWRNKRIGLRRSDFSRVIDVTANTITFDHAPEGSCMYGSHYASMPSKPDGQPKTMIFRDGPRDLGKGSKIASRPGQRTKWIQL